MIRFPLIEKLEVDGYALYPGFDQSGTLEVDLGKGPWLVLGVNGLGKSTLLLLQRYLLTGAVRTRDAGFAGEREDLQTVSNRFFAARVAGGLDEASATLVVRFGARDSLTIKRALSNLSLISATSQKGSKKNIISNEDEYRSAITSLVGVEKFEDVVRILDNLIFYLEDRQSLIWNLASQFEFFRAVLTPEHSTDLRQLEREIVSADSAARNLNATLYKISKRREREIDKQLNADDTRARIASLQGEVDSLAKQEISLSNALDAAEAERADYNLEKKRSEHEVDEAAQTYEKLKFESLRQAFAGVGPTEQYIFLKLLSDRFCIACNQAAPQAASELQERHEQGRCVVCGNPLEENEKVEKLGDALKAKAARAYKNLEAKRSELELYEKQYAASQARLTEVYSNLSAIRISLDNKYGALRRLRKKLPAGEGLELSREEERIRNLRSEVLAFRKERENAENSIEELLYQLKQAVEKIRKQLEAKFNARAAPFFAEQVRLVYAPRTSRIGQGGRSFEFPSFEIEMTSGATLGQFVRRTPEQVSLSQREYLDIIFRMALVETLGKGRGSLVIDGPEGSLDAVFASIAGQLFARFSDLPGTNVILACNVVDGDFIPYTLSGFKKNDRRSRILNLLEQAVPTQALNRLRKEYTEKVNEILARRVV